jgi:hypothetical protein
VLFDVGEGAGVLGAEEPFDLLDQRRFGREGRAGDDEGLMTSFSPCRSIEWHPWYGKFWSGVCVPWSFHEEGIQAGGLSRPTGHSRVLGRHQTAPYTHGAAGLAFERIRLPQPGQRIVAGLHGREGASGEVVRGDDAKSRLHRSGKHREACRRGLVMMELSEGTI